ncbi:hypothetical protein Vafri_19598 [Volvox africanus]|uniref:Uncharacterized protein n=1 Tax=Volvox africanus TaxID=51714 RepID=A0A8J4F8W0_9CHLO|nr:hypothetical protein Vafri_19598 [Volvox africanus]
MVALDNVTFHTFPFVHPSVLSQPCKVLVNRVFLMHHNTFCRHNFRFSVGPAGQPASALKTLIIFYCSTREMEKSLINILHLIKLSICILVTVMLFSDVSAEILTGQDNVCCAYLLTTSNRWQLVCNNTQKVEGSKPFPRGAIVSGVTIEDGKIAQCAGWYVCGWEGWVVEVCCLGA